MWGISTHPAPVYDARIIARHPSLDDGNTSVYIRVMASFTVKVRKLEDSRKRQNPARPSTVRRFIARFHRAVRAGTVVMSAAAQAEAWNDFRLDGDAVKSALLALTQSDFHHDEPSNRDPRQIIWVFTPSISVAPHSSYRAWIRIRETPGWYVVSFHRSVHA